MGFQGASLAAHQREIKVEDDERGQEEPKVGTPVWQIFNSETERDGVVYAGTVQVIEVIDSDDAKWV